MKYKVKDKYFKKAKQESFKARSVYKLEEIDKKYSIIKQGYSVLDLGSFPGSWCQYIHRKIKNNGRIVGVDIQKIENLNLANFYFIHKSIYDLNEKDFDQSFYPFDVITSDMAPKTTGIKDVDQGASMELVKAAYGICDKFLKDGGSFICKIFDNSEIKDFVNKIKNRYKTIKLYRAESTRKGSKEIFLIARGFIREQD